MAAPREWLGAVEAEGSSGRQGNSGVEVVVFSDPAPPAPLCPHGPTLLFVKANQGKEETRRFYACSACRDRKDCNFFQWEDEKLSGARLAAREAHNRRYQPPLSRSQCVERYSQFYMEDSFCHYNMFNHHFFDGKAALEVCRTFLQKDEGEGVIMVTDPPFGGLVEPLAVTFKKLIAMWKEGQSQDNSHKELPIFWIFPYFFESRICQFFPSFCMLDYQVDYDNHALYKHGKTGRKQSPVRIFTNIPPNKIILPIEEGYRFCPLCQRYVSLENQHCEHCNSCTSKDGRKWNHCFLCKKCVKPSWIHCNICNHCALPDHSCTGPKDGCFICGELDHKRSTCPNISTSKKVNKAVRKQKQRKSNKMKMETTKGQSMNHTSVTRKKKRRERAHQYLCS
ncbi:rRNA N6-adenosine-methyltransferase ZCCHC4 isoform X3 [Balaenoptera acutorostrata]|uniref:rRNA N(6)-adenosine-methyltransferase ZCCHC4 n=1 Tax=Balaenoptera acutorostrata TaxID=9767 RepID=A0A383Z036_BALAC|nr:rRNA N6-adenosine-methyltransferase ZCCHC4 isoform X3 [Balaenoptera acutorostrata]